MDLDASISKLSHSKTMVCVVWVGLRKTLVSIWVPIDSDLAMEPTAKVSVWTDNKANEYMRTRSTTMEKWVFVICCGFVPTRVPGLPSLRILRNGHSVYFIPTHEFPKRIYSIASVIQYIKWEYLPALILSRATHKLPHDQLRQRAGWGLTDVYQLYSKKWRS